MRKIIIIIPISRPISLNQNDLNKTKRGRGSISHAQKLAACHGTFDIMRATRPSP